MELALWTTAAAAAPVATTNVSDSRTAYTDLESIGRCVESALGQVVFTTAEIEGALALDDPSWRGMVNSGQ
jgi:hypothetical protein